MLTIYERENIFNICYDNENTEAISIKDFLKNIVHYASMGTDIYISNFNFWAVSIINNLYKAGLTDITKMRLEDNETKVESGEFSYILSADNGAFYSIEAKIGTKKCRFIEFKNLVPVELDDLKEEFGGTYEVAMHRAVSMIHGLKVRGITISSCAYSLWKKRYDRWDFPKMFQPKPEEVENICRDAYHGGLCFLKRNTHRSVKFGSGYVLDANSLYPFVMKNCSFPIGRPHYGKGQIPEAIRDNEEIKYYIRFRCSFKVKENCIPFARTRCDLKYFSLEKLTDSIYRDRDGKEYQYMEEVDEETGEIFIKEFTVNFCMYKPEYELFLETYDVWNLEEIEYAWYYTGKGIFDDYVNLFYDMKANAKTKGEKRIAKLFMNSLSGRMALKTERMSAFLDEDSLKNLYTPFDRKKAVKGRKAENMVGESFLDYIAGEINTTSRSDSHIEIGAAITSEAMCYMVRAINKNYKRFIYTDTDSLHFWGELTDIKGIELDDKKLGAFKVEHHFRIAEYFKEKIYFTYDWDDTAHLTFAGLPKDCQEIVEKYIETNTTQSKFYQEDIRNIVDFSKFANFVVKDNNYMKMVDINENVWKMIDPNREYDIDGLRIPRLVRKMDYEKEEGYTDIEYYKIDIFEKGA